MIANTVAFATIEIPHTSEFPLIDWRTTERRLHAVKSAEITPEEIDALACELKEAAKEGTAQLCETFDRFLRRVLATLQFHDDGPMSTTVH